MAPPNYLVIGLSGITCAGKTTLSAALSSHFGPVVTLLPLDEYFIQDPSRLDYIESVQHSDYDTMNSLEWDKYYADVKAVIDRFSHNTHCSAKQQILILDGFLLFNEPRLLALCHLKYDFTLSYHEAKRRREKRIYDPPDVPGYFDQVAWPAALKHAKEVEQIKKSENIVTVDGTEPMNCILERVLRDIELFAQDT